MDCLNAWGYHFLVLATIIYRRVCLACSHKIRPQKDCLLVVVAMALQKKKNKRFSTDRSNFEKVVEDKQAIFYFLALR